MDLNSLPIPKDWWKEVGGADWLGRTGDEADETEPWFEKADRNDDDVRRGTGRCCDIRRWRCLRRGKDGSRVFGELIWA